MSIPSEVVRCVRHGIAPREQDGMDWCASADCEQCEEAVWSELLRERDRLKAERDRALAELDKALGEREESDGWVRLPVDADGDVVHIGDVMEWCDSGDTLEVIGIGADDTLFYIDGENAEWTAARNKRHHHAPTVEDVLTEFADQYAFYKEVEKGVCPDLESHKEVLRQFAAKLRLANE